MFDYNSLDYKLNTCICYKKYSKNPFKKKLISKLRMLIIDNNNNMYILDYLNYDTPYLKKFISMTDLEVKMPIDKNIAKIYKKIKTKNNKNKREKICSISFVSYIDHNLFKKIYNDYLIY